MQTQYNVLFSLCIKFYKYIFVWFQGGVRGLVVSVVRITCPSPLWVRIPSGTLDSFMWGSYPAGLRNFGGCTQVPARAWNNAGRGTWVLPPPVKLECHHITSTVLVRHKIQPKSMINSSSKFYTNYIKLNGLTMLFNLFKFIRNIMSFKIRFTDKPASTITRVIFN